MQLYKGLSIATAKATPEEQSAAPHHLLDVATPGIPFNVLQFRDMALPIVSFALKFLFISLSSKICGLLTLLLL